MIRSRTHVFHTITRRTARVGTLIAGLLVAGCAHSEAQVEVEPILDTPTTFAVAPILNFSGEFSLDPIKAADLLASELSHFDGAAVLPVSRVAAFLISQGKEQIESPAHAIEVAEAVGADVLIVAGITEFDPYTPILGLAIQFYTVPVSTTPRLNPVEMTRQLEPMTLAEMTDALRPTAQVQRVYNAKHEEVTEAVRRFADDRSDEDNPLGWRQYLKVQTQFIRFCWHDAIRRLLRQQQGRQQMLAGVEDMETPA